MQTYIAAKALHPDQVRPLSELWPQCWRDELNERKARGWEIKWDRPFNYYDELGERMLSVPEIIQAVDDIEPLIVLEPEEHVVMERRVEFFVPGVPIPIVGYIDLIAADGVPVDFKTAGRAWSRGKEHTELQSDFYLTALMGDGLNPNRLFRYYVFTKTKSPKVQVLETSRTIRQLFFMTKVVQEVWRAIEAGAFPPNPTGWKCSEKYCEYYALCRGKAL